MREVYLASDPMNAEILRGYLAAHGIDVFVEGENRWGGRGELPADCYPRLMVHTALDFTHARALIADWEAGIDPRPSWRCDCGEALPGSFSDCWHCGREKPLGTAAA